MAVLDVACGTGNATIPAARAGANVTGLDLVPRLIEEGKAKAEAAGLEIE
jgi:2-polyprenyl-3-methyl-5-hydroxy-6-metoxy-1,4-benzoquinol methylase